MSESAAVIIAAFIAAGAAIWIGWLQMRALQQQNRIAAFDRRFEAFLQVQQAIEKAFVGGKPVAMEDIVELNRALRVCWFIFPKSLSGRLSKIREELVKLRSLRTQMWDDAGYPRDGVSQAELNQYYAAQQFIISEWEVLKETFHPFMSFNH